MFWTENRRINPQRKADFHAMVSTVVMTAMILVAICSVTTCGDQEGPGSSSWEDNPSMIRIFGSNTDDVGYCVAVTNDNGYSVAVTADGGYAVTGVTGWWCFENEEGQNSRGLLLIRTDSMGYRISPAPHNRIKMSLIEFAFGLSSYVIGLACPVMVVHTREPHS